jgi:PST family polysaccharide transporter
MTLPWLARVLGPAELGRVAVMQAIASCITLLVEYGFSFSATRKVAVNRDAPDKLSEIVASVSAAKVLLSLACIVLTTLCRPLFTGLEGHDWLYISGVYAGIAQAFTMSWYFIGIERMMLISVVESVLRFGAAIAVLTAVHSPADSWVVMTLQGTASALTLLASLAVAYRSVPFRLPHWKRTMETLAQGRGALLFRIAETSYTSCNAMILAWMCPLPVVGVYSSAEKIVRALVTVVLDPIHRAIYPRVASVLAVSQKDAAEYVRKSLLVTVTMGAISGALMFAGAPGIIRLLLGPGYESSIPVLRLLAIVPAAMAIKWGLGLNWMMLVGQSGTFTAIVAASAGLHATAAVLLAPILGEVGMAFAVVLTEFAVAAAVSFVRGSGPHPLRVRLQDKATSAYPQHDPEKVFSR